METRVATVLVFILSLEVVGAFKITFLKADDRKDNREIRNEDLNYLRHPQTWPLDEFQYEDYMYQSDAPIDGHVSSDVCPPVIPEIADVNCHVTNCSSDVDCEDGFRCCFNGCTYTCLAEVQPPAVFDWRVEPMRSRSGVSWLIDGPVTAVGEDEPCSTTPVGKDEDPLLCPHGYFCHVTDPGNPDKGKSNSGYCVKQNEGTMDEQDVILSAALSGQKTCKMDNIVLLDGAKIRLREGNCRCKNGRLSCGKRKRKTKVDVKVKPKKENKSKKDKSTKGKSSKKEKSKKGKSRRRGSKKETPNKNKKDTKRDHANNSNDR